MNLTFCNVCSTHFFFAKQFSSNRIKSICWKSNNAADGMYVNKIFSSILKKISHAIVKIYEKPMKFFIFWDINSVYFILISVNLLQLDNDF